jgi:thioredoxin reductase
MTITFDALIIGGSFAGLSAALQIARTRRKVCVLDTGTPRNRFAEAAHGFYAQDGVAPLALMEAGRAKLLAYPSVTFKPLRALSAQAIEGGFAVTVDGGETLTASKLVLAFGVEDELPDLPGLKERWGRSVLHCPYCHGFEFSGRRQGVLAVSPLSSHQALLIAEWGPTTYFLDGRDDLEPEARDKLLARGVTIEPGPVAGVEGEGTSLRAVKLADGREVAVETLYLGSRTRLRSPIAEQLGCAFDEGMFGAVIRTDALKLTTVPGVYAAGDIARQPHNATWASADGVTAGVFLHQSLVFSS